MTRSSFAPELSATFKRVSCWTMPLPGLLHDLKYAPSFLLGEGARLGDADEVAHAALVLLVVDLELGALLHGFPVKAVCLRRSNLDDDRLVHLVRDHGAEADLAPAARGRGGCLSGGVAHSAVSFFRPRPRFGLGASSSCPSSAWTSSGASATATATAPGVSSSKLGAMPKSRSRMTVMIRAMSWRTLAIWLEFSSCPTACLNRSSYSSRRAERSRMPSSSASRTRSSSTFISSLRSRQRRQTASSSAAWRRPISWLPSRPEASRHPSRTGRGHV